MKYVLFVCTFLVSACTDELGHPREETDATLDGGQEDGEIPGSDVSLPPSDQGLPEASILDPDSQPLDAAVVDARPQDAVLDAALHEPRDAEVKPDEDAAPAIVDAQVVPPQPDAASPACLPSDDCHGRTGRGESGANGGPWPDGTPDDRDDDGDGFTEIGGDCDDNSPPGSQANHPGAIDYPDDNYDNDCNGIIDDP